MPSQVAMTLEQFRARVLALDAAQMREMARQWLAVENALEGRIIALTTDLAYLRLEGKFSRSKLMELDRYRDLLAQTQGEIARYNQWAADLITNKQREMVNLGIAAAQAQIRAAYMDAGRYVGRFNLLPIEAVEHMIGMAGNGSPLYKLFADSYPETVLRLTQTMIDGVALGQNPNVVARLLRDDMAGNLERALTIARTEEIRAYRVTGNLQARESGVVKGWYWRAALQMTTCAACLAMDNGDLHPLEEEIDDHPNGRCFRQYAIIGLPAPDVISGTDWFAAQSETDQRLILGNEKYEAWKSGQFAFRDLAALRHSEEWGTSIGVRSLAALMDGR